MKIVPCTIRIRDLVAGCRNNEKLLPMTSDGTLMNDYSCGWMDGLTVWQVPFGWNVQKSYCVRRRDTAWACDAQTQSGPSHGGTEFGLGGLLCPAHPPTLAIQVAISSSVSHSRSHR